MSDKDRIPAEQLTAWERWELPVMNEQGETREAEESVRPPTAAELEAIREAAREEGFQSGYQAGHAEGLSQGRREGHAEGYAAGMEQGREEGRAQAYAKHEAELQARLRTLSGLISSLEKPLADQQETLEQTLVQLVLAVCRAVIFRELQLAPEALGQVVHEALAALPADEEWRVVLHPEDAALLRESGFEPLGQITEDAGLTRGGCRVQTRNTLVDYTLERRFQKTVQAMLSRATARHEDAGGHQPDYAPALDDLSNLHTDVLEAPDEPEPE